MRKSFASSLSTLNGAPARELTMVYSRSPPMARMVAMVIPLSPVVTVYSPPPSKRNSATTDTAPVSVAKSPLSARASMAKDTVRAL